MSEMSSQIREGRQTWEDRYKRGQDGAGAQGLDRVQGRVRQNQSSTSARTSTILRKANRLFSALTSSTHPSSGLLLHINSEKEIGPFNTVFFLDTVHIFVNTFWCAPFGYLYFSTINQNWVQESILAWLWPHFHLVYWMRQDWKLRTNNILIVNRVC